VEAKEIAWEEIWSRTSGGKKKRCPSRGTVFGQDYRTLAKKEGKRAIVIRDEGNEISCLASQRGGEKEWSARRGGGGITCDPVGQENTGSFPVPTEANDKRTLGDRERREWAAKEGRKIFF